MIQCRFLVFPAGTRQKFQVPRMQVLQLIGLFWGWGFPYVRFTDTAYKKVRIPPFYLPKIFAW